MFTCSGHVRQSVWKVLLLQSSLSFPKRINCCVFLESRSDLFTKINQHTHTLLLPAPQKQFPFQVRQAIKGSCASPLDVPKATLNNNCSVRTRSTNTTVLLIHFGIITISGKGFDATSMPAVRLASARRVHTHTPKLFIMSHCCESVKPLTAMIHPAKCTQYHAISGY